MITEIGCGMRVRRILALTVVALAIALVSTEAASAHLIDSVSVDPKIESSIELSSPNGAPGAALPATINVSNTGGNLNLTGKSTYLGSIFTSSIVRSWYAVLEAQNSTGAWTPVAGAANAAAGYSPRGLPSIATGLDFTAQPIGAYGVTYPTGADKIVGTRVAGLALALWNHQAKASVSPSQLANLLNSTVTPQVRLRVHIEAARTGLFGSQYVNVQERVATFGKMMRSQSAVATDVRLSLTTTGSPVKSFDSSSHPQLASLSAVGQAAIETSIELPEVEPKASGESDGDYIARLRAAAEQTIDSNLTGVFTASGAASPSCWWLFFDNDPAFDLGPSRDLPVVGDTAAAGVAVPVLEIAKSGPAEIDAGASADYEITVTSSGTAAADAEVEDTVDGQPSAAVTGFGQLAAGSTASGTHNVQIPTSLPAGELHDRASVTWTDAAANQFGPVSAEFTSQLTTDTTPPAPPTLISVPAALTSNNYAALEFSGEEGGMFRCSIDGAAAVDCISPHVLTDLPDGAHTFSVHQVDDAENVGSATTYVWTVDTTAPEAPSVSGAPTASTQSQSATISFTGEAGGSFECVVDGVAQAGCTSPLQLADLVEGTHTVTIGQIDDAGNSSATANVSWSVDLTAPIAPHLDSTPTPITSESIAGFGFTGEPGGSFECRIDAETFAACPNPKSYESLADGTHNFEVRQLDDAGNVGVAEAFSWLIDSTPPDLPQFTGVPTSVTFDDSATFEFEGEESAAFECSLDGAEFTPCTSPVMYSALVTAEHIFQVRQADQAGNVGLPAAHPWEIVSVIPDAPTLDATPADPTNQTTAAFTIGHASGNSLECSIDGQPFATCSANPTFTDLGEGEHFFSAKQVSAGGYSGATVDFSWTVDVTAPDWPTFNFVTEEFSNDGEIVVDWVPSDDAYMQCRSSYGEWSDCSTPFNSGPLQPGTHTYGFKWQDAAGNVTMEFDFTWTLSEPPPPADPVITSSPNSPTNSTTASVAFSQPDAQSVECSLDSAAFEACESPFAIDGLTEGTHTVSLRAVNASGVFSSVVATAWEVDLTAPDPPTITSAPDGLWPHSDSTFEFSGELDARFRCKLDNGTFKSCNSPRKYALLAAGAHSFAVRQFDRAGNASAATTHDWEVTVDPETAPPDAPPLDQTGVTQFSDQVSFLYSGPNPIQHGAEDGAFDERRLAVIRGHVGTTTNDPLAGVRVSVVGHPEFGASLSRDDGEVYFAVNGGGRLTLRFEKAGYPPVDRAVQVPWRDYAFVDDVVMTSYDPNVSPIELGSGGSGLQAAEGSTVIDTDGTRRATVLFPEGTTAQMRFADGETRPLTDLDVRITEYTVGENGPDAMPAALPGTTAYTYASEFSVDQALEAGASSVEFSQTVWGILENFLELPAGTVVPNGYYDGDAPGWKAQDNGEVMKIFSITDGIATLDDGSGQPMQTPPPSDKRHASWDLMMQYLGGRFSAGETFWMMPMEHFSPYDWNLPMAFPEDYEQQPRQEGQTEPEQDPCKQGGSIIECENQSLGESIPIPGTSMSLNYRSDRAPGRTDKSKISLNLTDSDPAPSLERVEVTIDVAGVRYKREFAPEPNGKFVFDWDGLDWAGRQLVGTHTARVIIDHIYPAWFSNWIDSGRAWARVNRVDGDNYVRLDEVRGASKLVSTNVFEYQVDALPHTPEAWETEPIAGWGLSPQHRFDPKSQTTLRGDGTRAHPDELSHAFERFAGRISTDEGGGGEENSSLPNTLFDADAVAAIDPVTLAKPLLSLLPIAAVGAPDATDPLGIGDGGQALDAELAQVTAMTVAADGSVLAAERYWDPDAELNATRIRKIDPNGVITTIAGLGGYGEGGDGGPALDAETTEVTAMAAGQRGEFYFVQGNRVRRVDSDGTITTFAGQVEEASGGPEGDGGPASQALLNRPQCIATGIDGSLYICDRNTLRHVDLSGTITTAVLLSMTAQSIAIDSRGVIYVGGSRALLRVDPRDYSVTARLDDLAPTSMANPCVANLGIGPNDRIYMQIASNYNWGECDKSRVGYTYLSHPRDGLSRLVNDFDPDAIGVDGTNGRARVIAGTPDGNLYSSAAGGHILRYGEQFTDHMPEGTTVPDPSGGVSYRFDSAGRHLSTLSTTTGQTLIEFGYDASNRLMSVTDSDGNSAFIERDASGSPTAIVSPFGQRTELDVGPDGLLSRVTTPAGRATTMQYDSMGLLTTFTNPNGATSSFTYDLLGRLIADEDAAGSAQTLALNPAVGEYSVTLRSEAGREKIVTRRELPGGSTERLVRHPSGSQSRRIERNDGSKSVVMTDGTSVDSTSSPDDRYGQPVQVPKITTITTQGGLTAQVETSVEHDVTEWWNPFSWNIENTTTSVNGKTSTSTLSREGQWIQSFSPAGRSAFSRFDEAERPTSTNIPGIAQSDLQYDARGRLDRVSQGSRSSWFAYNAAGDLSEVTDSLGRVTSYAYDPDGQVTSTTLPGGHQVSFTYDQNGNLTSLSPPERPAHEFSYDILGMLTGTTAPEESASPRTTTYEYATPDHDLTKITRPSGSVANLTYDPAGRLEAMSDDDGQTTLSYEPTTGNPSSVTAPNGQRLNFTYDGSLPTAQSMTGTVEATAALTYNNDFQLASATAAGETVEYTYDPDGLLTGAGQLILGHDADNGLLKSLTLGATATQITHNPYGEPESIDTDAAGTDLHQLNFTRDQAGRITVKQEIRPAATTTWAYNYDPSGRLENVIKDGAQHAAYTYDANGNRTSQTIDSNTTYATFDSRDRMRTQGDLDLTYNANGELTEKRDRTTGETLSLNYTTLGDLSSATTPAGDQINYILDGMGRRVGKHVGGSLTQGLLYSPEAFGPVAELDANNDLVARFIYTGAHVPAYMLKNGTTYRLLTDQLGSVVMVVDASSGAVAQELSYGPFGEVLSDSNPGFQPFGFAGGIYDTDTGLTHFGAREYDAGLGRWTASDPIGFNGGDTNLYGYTASDPVNWIDPSGLDRINDWGQAFMGFGDAVTLGLSKKARKSAGLDHVVDYCSSARGAGELMSIVMPGPGGKGRLLKFAAGRSDDVAGRAQSPLRRALSNLGDERGGSTSINGKPFRGPDAPKLSYDHLAAYHGVDPNVASNRLHAIKYAGGLGGTDHVVIGKTGDVYDARTEEWLGTLTDSAWGN